MPTSAGPNLTEDSLLVYLDAADTNSYASGSGICYDLINGVTGSLENNPGFTSSGIGAFDFGGTNDYINLGITTGQVDKATLSYGCWFYWDGNAQDASFFAKRNGTPYNQYNIGISNSAMYGGSGTNLFTFFRSDQSAGSLDQYNLDLTNYDIGWIHVTISVGELSQTMYVNGESVISSSFNLTGDTFIIEGRNLLVGCGVGNTGTPWKYFNGLIANMFIYDKALTAEEVQQNFNAQKSRFNL